MVKVQRDREENRGRCECLRTTGHDNSLSLSENNDQEGQPVGSEDVPAEHEEGKVGRAVLFQMLQQGRTLRGKDKLIHVDLREKVCLTSKKREGKMKRTATNR